MSFGLCDPSEIYPAELSGQVLRTVREELDLARAANKRVLVRADGDNSEAPELSVSVDANDPSTFCACGDENAEQFFKHLRRIWRAYDLEEFALIWFQVGNVNCLRPCRIPWVVSDHSHCACGIRSDGGEPATDCFHTRSSATA